MIKLFKSNFMLFIATNKLTTQIYLPQLSIVWILKWQKSSEQACENARMKTSMKTSKTCVSYKMTFFPQVDEIGTVSSSEPCQFNESKNERKEDNVKRFLQCATQKMWVSRKSVVFVIRARCRQKIATVKG
jgi:hypothetical protein